MTIWVKKEDMPPKSKTIIWVRKQTLERIKRGQVFYLGWHTRRAKNG